MNPAVISAVAAIVAATFSGTTLYISGRREQRKWARDATVQALVDLVDASYRSAGQKGFDARSKGSSDLDAIERTAKDAREQQSASLTRLRLIAPEEIVVAVQALLDADTAVNNAVLGPNVLPTTERWKELRDSQWDRRAALQQAGRKYFGISALSDEAMWAAGRSVHKRGLTGSSDTGVSP